MAHLTLRTLLAYIDDTLEPTLARQLGAKVAESEIARELIERIKKVTRRRGLKSPTTNGADGEVSDPNTVAEYLSDNLDGEQVKRLEQTCLESDVHLAEIAACHQILTIILTEPVLVPPQARQRMYGLVPPPASIPNRKPSKALPVSGVKPRPLAGPDADDADATLLLGLERYSGGSVFSRLILAGAAAILVGLLVIAVLMALPHDHSERPPMEVGYALAQAPPPTVPATPANAVPIMPMPAPPPPPESGKPVAPMPPPVVVAPEPQPVDKGPAFPAPNLDRVVLGKVESVNVIVLTRPNEGPSWVRLDPAGNATVTGHDPVLCLPGYKADVQLLTGVKVRLWGNVPEQLPDRILEARVRFHLPERKPDGKDAVDADISLLAGRIYLSSTRPEGGRVRVRFGREVWDITLADDKTDVVVQFVSAFEPGMEYVKKAGAVQQDARLAVIRGTADLACRTHVRNYDKLSGSVIDWTRRAGDPGDPKRIEPGNGYFDKFPLYGSDQGKAVQKLLTEMAGRLNAPDGVRVMLAEVLTAPPDPSQALGLVLAVYAQAATIYGSNGDELKPLIDLLTDDTHGVGVRVAVVNALAAWLPKSPGNSAMLEEKLAPKLRREGEPELILRLLRGYINPTKPDPADLDRLVEFLNNPSVAVRELALWNLVNFVDPDARRLPGLITDVGFTGPGYEKFIKAWEARIEELKKRPRPK